MHRRASNAPRRRARGACRGLEACRASRRSAAETAGVLLYLPGAGRPTFLTPPDAPDGHTMVLLPRQHLAPVPLLPTRGSAWGPFASRGAHRAPAPAEVSAACAALALFLVACALAAPERLDVPAGGGSGGARRLTQFLAPVWYALPTLFDSIYNLVRAFAPLDVTPRASSASAPRAHEPNPERRLSYSTEKNTALSSRRSSPSSLSPIPSLPRRREKLGQTTGFSRRSTASPPSSTPTSRTPGLVRQLRRRHRRPSGLPPRRLTPPSPTTPRSRRARDWRSSDA